MPLFDKNATPHGQCLKGRLSQRTEKILQAFDYLEFSPIRFCDFKRASTNCARELLPPITPYSESCR